MSAVRCPHCDALLPAQEIAAGRCENCGTQILRQGIPDTAGIQEADKVPTVKVHSDPLGERSQRPQARRRNGSGPPCPECGSRYLRSGPWPWYLGTVGAMLCRPVICEDCGHEFDANKPRANLATRKRNLAIAINLVGLLGIPAVIAALVLWIWWVFKQ